jgi:polypeptide N-acetylgalactosaminyltransferase
MPDPHVGLENIKEDSRPDPDRLMDWHNWTHIRLERERAGPGEQGKPVQVSAEEERQHSDLFRSNGFSGWASDKISVHRAVPDIRC